MKIGKRQSDLERADLKNSCVSFFSQRITGRRKHFVENVSVTKSSCNMLILLRKADVENMKKLMKAKLMRKTCGGKMES